MNLYQKIEDLYQENNKVKKNQQDDINTQILVELRQIKDLLSTNYVKPKTIDSSFREFIAKFRKNLMPNENTYPEINYKNQILGVNYKGLLYDKSTSNLLSRSDAFEVYGYFYQKSLRDKNI